MNLRIHTFSDPLNILRVDLTGLATDPAEVKEHHAALLRLCKDKNGLGVAANQVGIRANFFFLMPSAKIPNSGNTAPVAHICIRPTWTPCKDAGKAADVEGCLSIPGRLFRVERYTSIDAEWINAVGHRVQKRLKGFTARVFQHEHDHLKGLTLLDTGEEVK